MRRIEPALVAVLTDLERGLRELRVPFGIVGALVPELLLDARPARLTNDADIVVVSQSVQEFETLKDHLAPYGFTRTSLPYRMRHSTGGLLDMLPYSESIAPDGRLQLQDDQVLNMAGFRHAITSAVSTAIDGSLSVPVIPLPLYALLKLVAFNDRRAPKDLSGVLHCLEHYLEDGDRRYQVEFEGAGVPYDYGCAYLLGLDSRDFVDADVRTALQSVLKGFDGPDAPLVGTAGAERGVHRLNDEQRTRVFECFRWYRRGLGV